MPTFATLFFNSLEKNGKCQKREEIPEWFYLRASHSFVIQETILLNGFIEINLNYVHIVHLNWTLWGKFIFLDKQTNQHKNGY